MFCLFLAKTMDFGLVKYVLFRLLYYIMLTFCILESLTLTSSKCNLGLLGSCYTCIVNTRYNSLNELIITCILNVCFDQNKKMNNVSHWHVCVILYP